MDRDGDEKSVLGILIGEAVSAGIEEVCVVVYPGDEDRYGQAAGKHAGRLRFVPQTRAAGYGGALWTAREFTANQPFLHLVGDHLHVSGAESCARRLVECARTERCAVSAVQVTREGLLSQFGAVGGRRMAGHSDLYRVETVVEKPTPTEAEQRLMIPGLRAGHYLCFFGMHVLTPLVMDLLDTQVRAADGAKVPLSPVLADLARREQYLAVEEPGRRFDLGVRYGLMMAQFALSLSGRDRNDVLTQVVELLTSRELGAAAGVQQ